MQITKRNDIYVATSSYAERHLPKAAGFFWHGGQCRPNCKACAAGVGQVWWTSFVERAQRLAQYADDTCRAELSERAEAKEQTMAASSAVDASIEIPAPAGHVYRPFQRAGIAFATARRNVLIADEMGLGKTIQALGAINATPAAEARNILVLMPANVRVNWKVEAQRWLTRPYNFHTMLTAELPEAANFVLVNYDRLTGANGKAVFAALRTRTWDFLICDEAHRLKNVESQRSKAVLGAQVKISKPGEKPVRYERQPGLVDNASRLVFLTGTPIENRPKEMFPLLNALDPKTFPSFFPFALRYCAAIKKTIYVPGGRGRTTQVWDFTGKSNELELQEKLRSTIMVRRLKKEVEKELPEKTWQVVTLGGEHISKWVELEAQGFTGMEALERAEQAQATGSADALQAALNDLQGAFSVDFKEFSKARHELAKAKVESAIEFIDDALESTQKVIVFAHHSKDLDDPIPALKAHYGDAAVVIDGSVDPEKRQPIVDRFQNDPTVRVFLGGIRSAGEGITLTAASTVIFLEMDPVPSKMQQAIDRAHRIGQKNAVVGYILAFEGTLDARLAQLLADKAETADLILDRELVTDAQRVAAAQEAVREERVREEHRAAKEAAPEKALSGFCAICGATQGLVHNDGMSDFCAAHAA